MVPIRFASAGCGSCHTHVRVPGTVELTRGRNLFERHDCLACHRIDGRGGTLRPAGTGGMEGPDLSAAGAAGFDPAWYEKHLQQNQQASTGPWKDSFGVIEPVDRRAIEGFLASCLSAPRLVQAKAAFHSLGCRGCHKVGGVGGDDGPDLTLAGQKDPARLDFTHVPGEPSLANWIAEHFRDPAKVVPGSLMPKMALSEEDIDLLTLFTLSLRRTNVPEAYWPKDRIRTERFGEREFGLDGATLYGTFCAACHGRSGEGLRYPGMSPNPAVANPDFLAAASDAFMAETIRRGRPGRRMPAWGEKEGGLRPEEIREIVAHLRQRSGVVEPKPAHADRRWVKVDPRAGERVYAQICAGCHGSKGEGLQAPALRNAAFLSAASDDYLVETIGRGRRGTPMNGFRNPSTVFPSLAPGDIESIVAHLRTWETQK
jgi:mono/diheme cytochrome c family protein